MRYSSGRGSWFAVQADELADVQQRLDNRELRITAPLRARVIWGLRMRHWPLKQDSWHRGNHCGNWRKRGADNARRALMLYPEHFTSEWMDDETVRLSFFLPAGSFATSVIREIIELEADQAAEFSE